MPKPPENIGAPAIVPVAGKPHDYRCDPGTWVRRDPAIPYKFTWLRLTSAGPFAGIDFEQPVAAGETFHAGATSKAQMLALSWRFRCTVEAANAGGAASASSSPVTLDPIVDGALGPGKSYGNFRIRGIDVFQSVQPNAGARAFGYDPGVAAGEVSQAYGLDMAGGGTPTSYKKDGTLRAGTTAQTTEYTGVPLDDDKLTTAVVYADMDGVPPGDPKLRLQVTLSGWTVVDGKRTKLGQTTETIGPPPVGFTRWVLLSEREDPNAGVQITVPYPWLEEGAKLGRLDLQAHVGFAPTTQIIPPTECAVGGCSEDDDFRLSRVPVSRLPELRIMGIELREASDTWSTKPWDALKRARDVFPGGDRLAITSSGAFININDIVNDWTIDSPQCKPWKEAGDFRACQHAAIDARMDEWEAADHSHTYDVLFGLHDYPGQPGGAAAQPDGEPGWEHRDLTAWPTGRHAMMTANIGTLQRPLTSAAHELGHVLGLEHAGRQCPVAAGVPGNQTGAGAAQQGEPWPTDDRGRLQSLRFDRSRLAPDGKVDPQADSGADPAAATIANPAQNPPKPGNLLDLMSYCNVFRGIDDSYQWLSARNWNHVFRQRPPTSRTARTHSAQSASAGRTARSRWASSAPAAAGSSASCHLTATRPRPLPCRARGCACARSMPPAGSCSTGRRRRRRHRLTAGRGRQLRRPGGPRRGRRRTGAQRPRAGPPGALRAPGGACGRARAPRPQRHRGRALDRPRPRPRPSAQRDGRRLHGRRPHVGAEVPGAQHRPRAAHRPLPRPPRPRPRGRERWVRRDAGGVRGVQRRRRRSR